MDKLTMAHEYAIEMAKQGIPLKSCKELGWKYADAMQAEADKRTKSEKDEFYANLADPMKKVREHKEWQPDWSQAPDVATHWTMRPDGKCLWWKGSPLFDGCCFYDAVGICHTVGYAPSFDYQGTWQDSLRKRPEGK